jgi:signal transduction histidine kinase
LVYNVAKNPAAYEGHVNENIKKNGQRVWVAWTNRPLLDESGQLVEILSIGTDITKLVEAEKELRETMTELDRAKVRAESADRLKSAFLATMSHELRTPLNSIIGFTGILLQRLGGPLNEEQEKQLGMVYNSARHLLDLINDVLDISKIEAGQLNVVHEGFDLRESIERVMKSSQPLADKKGIEFSSTVAPEIGAITGDRRRVEQILLNLISNAIKFTEVGYVRLQAEVRGNDIVIDVRDSGIGIKREDMGILFNAFQQIESGITRKYDGTGLGLSICEKLAHLLGGEIRVESEWGRGSTFSLILTKERETI